MWNHTQNCSPKGDEDNNEADKCLKERIEKSLDLSQYLKYLDQLFGQGTSESDSNDSDDGEKNRTFTEFRQPPVAPQPLQQGHSPGHLLLGPSSVSDSCNLVHSFTALKPTDSFHNFQIDSNISSSSLSSIDSGTSSLSLNLSSDTCYLEASQGKTENTENGVGKSSEIRCSAVGSEEEKSGENNGDKEKKSQKKKKSGRNSNETFPRQHKPSSGGKGNNGPKGGGGSGGSAPGGGSSNDNSGGSSGSSSNQSISGNSGSPGAKSRSGKHNLQKQTDSQPETNNIKAANDSSSNYNKDNADCNGSANLDLQRALGIHDSTENSLLLNEELDGSFDTEDTFDGSGMSSFPLNSILDNIPDEETSIGDLISMSATLDSTSPSPSSVSPFSTNLFSKIAQSAAAVKISSDSNSNEVGPTTNSHNGSDKLEGKKRKLENRKEPPQKFSKLTEKQKQSRIEYLNAKRRKIYVYISRKEVIKTQKTRAIDFKEGLAIKRKLAQACARQVKKNAIQSQKCMKESVCKAKRLTQEMEVYWRSVEKSERDLQRKVEKEAEDKLKKDVNVLNRIRNGKLSHLITQIELFVNKLLNKIVIEVNEDDLVSVGAEGISLDGRNSERLKSSVHNNIDRAVKEHRSLVKLLDMSGVSIPGNAMAMDTSSVFASEGFLKNHQIFGINWIRNLYNKGLNGILADESGLGKKAQVTGFLSRLAESYGLWGPFLIVTQSDSIKCWQQEFNRLLLKFKVVPYCGKPMERKILRHGWDKNGIHTEEAGFHVVLTSHQVMAADLKYFSKTKWQYLIMDDSQNVVTSSTKWMALLSFRCRNKLLLCGNPQLSSFRHLCSYLYFVMPSLFDSQKELSEWLLMELESPTTNSSCKIEEDKSGTLKRLQIITQKFLLRRELPDVETETTPCIDLQLNCTLTKRQRQIYSGLLEKADLRGIVSSLESCDPAEIRTRMKTVLNLSCQLRKACNHPDLIEEPDCLTSFWMDTPFIVLPRIVYQNGLMVNHTQQLLARLFCIYNAFNIFSSFFAKSCTNNTRNVLSTWSFVRLLNLGWKEVEELFLGGNAARLHHLVNYRSVLERMHHDAFWLERQASVCIFNYHSSLLYNFLIKSKTFSSLLLCSHISPPHSPSVGSWRKCKTVVFNTVQYRSLKSKNYFQGLLKNPQNPQTVQSTGSCHTESVVTSFSTLEYPDALQCYVPAVYSEGYKPYTYCQKSNQQMLAMENRISATELINAFPKDKLKQDRKLVSVIKESLMKLNWSQTFFVEYNSLIERSGKMMMLDKLLSSLMQPTARVLLVSYMKESLAILEEFLRKRRWKYSRMEDGIYEPVGNDPFIYLMYAHSAVTDNFRITIDSVVFFDQDWDTKLEDQKSKVLSKLGCRAQMNYYRMICQGTIEERMITLAKQTNIVSLTLSKDVFENKLVSSVPALKSLLSILMCELSQRKAWVNETSFSGHNPSQIDSSSMMALLNKDKANLRKTIKYRKENLSHDHHKGGVDLLHYVNDNDESDSASPSCSEEPEIYMVDDDDNGGGMMGFQDDDNFSLSFDEGYMGMSPDSFEDVTIKSDYEDSPKKTKLGRGSGRRGRPPSRVRFHRRDLCDGSETIRRGPGRPRLKTVGPANQGTRGRKPGRPPLTKKAETISSGLASLSSGQNVFGFYSSPDLELS